LDQAGFGPHEADEIMAAFEATLAALQLVRRPDAITTLIARTIIECAKTGHIDRSRLRDCAIQAISAR
jgi:hypothetical protein